MPKRSSKDLNLTAYDVFKKSIQAMDSPPPILSLPSTPLIINEPTKNPAAVALGRLGGLKGGKARAAALTAQKRREIAKKAAKLRWKNNKK
ncbi:MAG TPA: hypothetical protein VFV23_05240 [Verrucomicrobiae bacterium]|nr:hypothetical protein [Verrucomicrobiae bacterium]